MKKSRIVSARTFLLVVVVTIVASAIAFFLPQILFPPDRDKGPQEAGKREDLKTSSVARGNIYDRNLQELAVSFRLASIYARPLEMENIDEAAHALALVLNRDEKELLTLFKTERSFLWLGRHLAAEKSDAVLRLNMRGIHLTNEKWRFYPRGKGTAHALGFMKEEQGLDGVEFYYDQRLRGILSEETRVSSPPAHLVLTLDLRLQAFIEAEINKFMKKVGAREGMAVVMNPYDGVILSLVNLPSFDPNHFWDYEATVRRNNVISAPVFPGALLRLLQPAATWAEKNDQPAPPPSGPAENSGSTQPGLAQRHPLTMGQTTVTTPWIEAEPGLYLSKGLALWPDQEKVAHDQLVQVLSKLGLDRLTGIDLPSEVTGNMMTADSAARQVPQPTTLQLINAFATLVNGGKRVRPHLLHSYWTSDHGREIPPGEAEQETVLAPDLSQRIRDLIQVTGQVGKSEYYILESVTRESVIPKGDAGGGEPLKSGDGQPAFQSVLLAMPHQEQPEIIAALVFSGVSFAPDEASPMAVLGARIMSQALKFNREPTTKTESSPRVSQSTDIYKQWEALYGKGTAISPFSAIQEGGVTMPDVIGRSLRGALQILGPYGLSVKVKGSGKVIRQHPATGAPLVGQKGCVLELTTDK